MNLIISEIITGKMWYLTPHYDLDLGLGDIKRTGKHKKDHSLSQSICLPEYVYAFNVPPTAKAIWRGGHGLESHPTDWRSQGSN